MKWFKHYADASDDEFIEGVEDRFGWEGYGRWWKLLETVAKQMDETGKCSVSYSWNKWQTKLKGKRNKLKTYLEHLENEQKIKTKQTGNVLEIEIPNLLKLRDNYSKNLQASKQVSSPKDCKQEVEVDVEEDNSKKTKKKTSIGVGEILEKYPLAERDHVEDWLLVRKNKRAPLTKTAWNGVVREIEKSGLPGESILELMAEKGWQGFKAEWLGNLERNTPQSPEPRPPHLKPFPGTEGVH